jgi:hypothetical protein
MEVWFSSPPACDFCPVSKKLTVHLFKISKPEAAGRAQVKQTIFVQCSRNHVCFHSQINFISLKYAQLYPQPNSFENLLLKDERQTR